MNIFARIAIGVLAGLAALYALFFFDIAPPQWRVPLAVVTALIVTSAADIIRRRA